MEAKFTAEEKERLREGESDFGNLGRNLGN